MTIRKGEEWGTPDVVPADSETFHADDGIARASGPAIPAGGDLWRCLGRPTPRIGGDACTRVLIDRLECSITTRGGIMVVPAVSHVRVGSWLGRGRFVVVSNVGFLGEWNVAPRAHPNDGVFDVFTMNEGISFRERLIARHRSKVGDHLPHPSMDIARVGRFRIVRHGRERLVIDGSRVRDWESVMVTIEPDALTVLI